MKWLVACGVLIVSATAVASAPEVLPTSDEAYPALFRESVHTYSTVEKAYRSEDYASAQKALNAFWQKHPRGSREWKKLQAQTGRGFDSVADFGNPPAYAALRMVSDCLDWRTSLQGREWQAPAHTIQFTTVLVGASESQDGVVRTIDPTLMGSQRAEVFDDAYWLFDEYVLAMSNGRVGIKRVVVDLPKTKAAVMVSSNGVKIPRETTDAIAAAVPESISRATDWWHVVYPSQVAPKSELAGERFVSGGMRGGPPGSYGPCFVSEDFKFLRMKTNTERRLLSQPERRAMLPQWFQHELFHYVFGKYHRLGLEAVSHQWHNRKAWPPDFEGLVEADYYAEALHKRIAQQTRPSLESVLRGITN